MQRIKKGDNVVITSGKYFGKQGIVLKILPKENKALVEGLNKVKRHKKADQQNNESGIVEKENYFPLCKLALLDTKAKEIKPTRVKYIIDEKTNKKIRVARKTGNPVGGK